MNFNKFALSIILIVFTFHILLNFYILHQNRVARIVDEAYYIGAGIDFYSVFINKQFKAAVDLLLKYGSFRNFYPLTGGLALIFLDKLGLKGVESMVQFTNALFFCILLFSVYNIGAILYDRKTGLIASILLSFSPVIFNHSRLFITEFPLAAMLCLSFVSLLKTENFLKPSFSLFTGVLLVLTQLTKETAFIFVLPPLLFYCLQSSSIVQERKKRMTNMAVTVLLFLTPLAAAFFIPHLLTGNFPLYLLRKSLIKMHELEYFYYLKRSYTDYLGALLFVALLPLSLSCILRPKRIHLFLALWLIIPLIFFSILPNRLIRFLIPALPPLFLLLASGLLYLPSGVRKAYTALILSAALFQYSVFNFFPGFPLPAPHYDWGVIQKDEYFFTVDKLVDIFKKEKNRVQGSRRIVSTFCFPYLTALFYRFKIDDLPFFMDIPQGGDSAISLWQKNGQINWQERLLTVDYLLDKTGDLGSRGYYADIGGEFKKSLELHRDKFKKIAEFKAEDGESIYVYKKILDEP